MPRLVGAGESEGACPEQGRRVTSEKHPPLLKLPGGAGRSNTKLREDARSYAAGFNPRCSKRLRGDGRNLLVHFDVKARDADGADAGAVLSQRYGAGGPAGTVAVELARA